MTGGRAALLVEFLSCLLLMCTSTVRSPKAYLVNVYHVSSIALAAELQH